MDEKTLWFIDKAKLIHGNLYSYERVIYKGSNKKVKITCPIHGDFEQTPSNHYKYKCSKCSIEEKGRKKIAKAETEFLNKVKDVHGCKYDLSKINYHGSAKKILVGCFNHGDFEIAAKHFLSGSGCKICGKLNAAKNIIIKARRDFKGKARKIHGDKYSYEEVDYNGLNAHVQILCYKHGYFSQTPRKHLSGSGCHICANKDRSNSLTTVNFIDKAKLVHGDRYDYSQTTVVASDKVVNIICKEHGSFSQYPYNHTKGSGCRLCAVKTRTKTTKDFIFEVSKRYSDYYDYSLTHYITHKEKVLIICPKHGQFYQSPRSHMAGIGCIKCRISNRKQKLAHDTLRFINDSQLIHGDLWDYSKTEYINNSTKVIITCPEHGDFKQRPSHHKRGSGCHWCGKDKNHESTRLATSDFILRSIKTHGDKYDYSEAIYTGIHNKIKINCLKHGFFYQLPSNHFKGSGCNECAIELSNKKLTLSKADFLSRAMNIHQNKYDYSLLSYKNLRDHIRIICPLHGEFSQLASYHLYGKGCPECSKLQNRMQTPLFMDKAKAIHGNKYDYSLVNCQGTASIINIICKKHGKFEQRVFQHLTGSGCRKCYVDSTKLSKESFINDCIATHGHKYNYSKVEYKTIRDKVIITCSEHGDFLQIAHDHKHGSNCPSCANYIRILSNKEPSTPCYLYYLTLKHEDYLFYKVGITTKGVEHRFKALSKDGVELIEKQAVLTTLHKAIIAEQSVLSDFIEHKLYMLDVLVFSGGGTECFADDVLSMHQLILDDYL